MTINKILNAHILLAMVTVFEVLLPLVSDNGKFSTFVSKDIAAISVDSIPCSIGTYSTVETTNLRPCLSIASKSRWRSTATAKASTFHLV